MDINNTMVTCGLCQPAYLRLQDEIRRLKQDLQNKQELIMGLSSVATAQAKHLSTMNSSRCAGLSTKCSTTAAHSETTLPWSGSITTGREPILALNDDIWPIVRTGFMSQTCSTPCNLSWAKHSARSSLSETLLLSNKFQALDTRDGPRSPVGLQQSGYPLSSARSSVPGGGPSVAADSASPPAALASTAAAGCYRDPAPARASAPEHDGCSTNGVDRTLPSPTPASTTAADRASLSLMAGGER